MRAILMTALAVGAAAAASCAQVPASTSETAAASGRQCFLVNNVRSFSGEGDGSIVVHASQRTAYELTALGYCQEIDWANHVALRTFGGASSLCVGDQADLIVQPLGGSTERCRVRVTRRLTETEVEDGRESRR